MHHIPSMSLNCIMDHIPSMTLNYIMDYIPSMSLNCIMYHIPSMSLNCIMDHIPSMKLNCIMHHISSMKLNCTTIYELAQHKGSTSISVSLIKQSFCNSTTETTEHSFVHNDTLSTMILWYVLNCHFFNSPK